MENLINRKKRFEGYRDHFYYDTQGYLTSFWGHNHSGQIPRAIVKEFGDKWTETYPLPVEVGEAFLHEDTVKSLTDVMAVFGFKIDLGALDREFPYEVLTVMDDMMFNMGMSRFLMFKRMIAAIKEGDYRGAAEEIKWVNAQKQVKHSLYYAQIDSIVNGLKNKGIKNVFHRAEENIALLIQAANAH